MIIDFTKVLKTMEGEPLKDGIEDLTLKSVCVNGLLATMQNDQPSGEEKLKRYLLATQINNDDEVDVSAEDISLIKKMVGMSFPTIVAGQAFMMLEGQI
jgi:hypothetical protein